MSRRFHLISLILLLSAAAYWWFGADHGSAPQAAADVPEQTEQPQTLSKKEIQRQFEAVEREKQASLAHLNSQGAELLNRDQAAMKRVEAREQLQVSKQAAWSRVLVTNGPAYQKLRTLAVSSRNG